MLAASAVVVVVAVAAAAVAVGDVAMGVRASDPPFPTPKFDCPRVTSPVPAQDVTRLHPSDVKVVMAMGDSITAGFAMKGTFPTDVAEYRDYVYSIGAADDAFTLYNMIKHYNPNLVGGAESWTVPMTKGQWLDAAVSMAQVQHCPSQVDYLVEQLQTTYKDKVDFENDWKVLTFFIGANNICEICHGDGNDQPDFFEKHLREVLGMIEAKIPRVFVNVLTIFNISGVYEAGMTREYCRVLWDGLTNNECSCLTTGKAADREAMDRDSVAFNVRTRKVVAEFAAKKNPNFTAVVQPGLENIDIPYYGESFLSRLDCFHPSLWADEAFAFQLWQNMFAPPGKKSTQPPKRPFTPEKLKVFCPTNTSVFQ